MPEGEESGNNLKIFKKQMKVKCINRNLSV